MAVVTPAHLFIKAGASFRQILTWTDDDGNPIPVAGYDARLQIREHRGFPPLLDLTVGDGITFGPEANQVSIYIGASRTAALPYRSPLRYDLRLVAVADVEEAERLVQGAVVVDPAVTQ